MTIWDGEAALSGEGVILDLPSTLMMPASQTTFNGAGGLTALGIKPPNRISVLFHGTGSVNIVTISPRLVASAMFVGEGDMVQKSNASSTILSTANSVRMSFPTIPNSGDPFVRRPSKTYSNYSISARFSGSGRLTSIAS